MKENDNCPFCGSMEWEVRGDDLYHCHECDRDFTADDAERERLRQRISAICSANYATEAKPINCDRPDAMELHISGIAEQAQGLCEALKPQATAIFSDSDGVVWATIDGEMVDVSEITVTDSLREILHWLEEEFVSAAYLAQMIRQEQEALDKAIANGYGEEVVAAIRRRLNNFKEDLDKIKEG